jgi:hypothetical protein
MAPAHTATLTRDTTTDRKTLPRFHQIAPRARHQTDVVFPPKSDSQALRHEQREPLLAAAGAARSPLRRIAAPKRRTVSLAASSVYTLGLNVTPAKALKRRIGLMSLRRRAG